MRRPSLFTLLLVAASALGGVWACSDSGPNAPGARVPVSFGLQPALDTVPVGDTVLFVAQRADSTVDVWTLSDTSIAHLVAQERGRATILTRAAGTVTITATRQGDTGQATLVVVPAPPPPPPPPPPPASFGILPAVDTIEAGGWVGFVAERADSTVDAWVSSDSNAAPVLERARGWATVSARAPGTFTVKAVRGADSGLATLVILPFPPPDTSGGWEAIDLGLLDAFRGAPTAIDDNGTIVGWLMQTTHNAEDRGFIYKDGVMRKLSRYGDHDYPSAIGPSGEIVGVENGDSVLVWDDADAAPRRLPSAPPGYDTRILGVNARGDILATLGDNLGTLAAAVWRNEVPQNLGGLRDFTRPSTYARAWNSRGQIVGASSVVQWSEMGDIYDYFHPFLWEDGVMRDLGVLAPRSCSSGVPATDCSAGEATDINSDGVIVGTSNDAEGRARAVIWENGVIRDLGVFPGHWTAAAAINDRGQVLGRLGRPYENDTTFFWDHGQVQIVVTDAAAWPGVVLGPRGEVVGTRLIGGREHAFIWQAGHLTDLGVGSAWAINSRGEIIGERGSFPTLWRKKRG